MRKGRNTVFFVASHLTNIFETTDTPESGPNSFESESENTVMLREILVRGILQICLQLTFGIFS